MLTGAQLLTLDLLTQDGPALTHAHFTGLRPPHLLMRSHRTVNHTAVSFGIILTYNCYNLKQCDGQAQGIPTASPGAHVCP